MSFIRRSIEAPAEVFRNSQMVIVSSTLLALLLLCSSAAASPPFNATILRLPPAARPDSDHSTITSSSSAAAATSSFLKEVVKAVAAKERWDPNVEVRVSGFSDLETTRTSKVGVSQRYQFLFRVGRKRALTFKFEDEIVSWRKEEEEGAGVAAVELVGSDLVAGYGAAGIRPAVRSLELVGPLELRASGGGDGDGISIHLPALNITQRSLKRIFVGNGIVVKIEGAQEVSLIHPYDIGLSLNGSLAANVEGQHKFRNLGYSSCAPLLTVQVGGPASVIAYKKHYAAGKFETSFKSQDTLELFLAKCYSTNGIRQISHCSFCSFSSKFTVLRNVLRSFLGNRIFQDKYIRFLKANITSSVLVKFQLELERDIRRNDRSWSNVPEWKQRPKTERTWVKIVARVESGRRLKPVLVKKLKTPFHIADSTAWSNLMSNISFTQFSSLVVPQEALTLDVKW